MSKNMVEPERTETIWLLHLAYWISKPTRAQAHACACASTPARTHTPALAYARAHREIYNTYCFSTVTVVTWTRLRVTLCVHCLSCLHSSQLLVFPRMLLCHVVEIVMYRVMLWQQVCHLHAVYGINFLYTVRTGNVNPCLDLVSY